MATRKTATNTEVATAQESSQVTGLTVADLAERTMERWSNSDLRGITDYEDALRQAVETYGEVVDVSQVLGNGFALLSKEDKRKLVGKPFLLLYWTFNPGDYGDYFASAAAITPDHQKFILNDGSTGIYSQLAEFSIEHDGRQGALMVAGGLRASDYPTCPACERPRNPMVTTCRNTLSNGTECGDTSEERHSGTTFYLETSRQPV